MTDDPKKKKPNTSNDPSDPFNVIPGLRPSEPVDLAHPTNLAELGAFGNFNYKAGEHGKTAVDANKYGGSLYFVNGNYQLPAELKDGMLRYGEDILAMAANKHVNLATFPEFKGLAKDGKVSAAQAGAMALALSMYTRIPPQMRCGEEAKITSDFDNKITPGDYDRANHPQHFDTGVYLAGIAEDVVIAREILKDNGISGVKATTPEADKQQFIQDVRTKGPRTRGGCE